MAGLIETIEKTLRHEFVPRWSVRARVHGLRTAEELQEESMLYSASPAFASANGGPLTKWLVDFVMGHIKLQVDPDLQVVIDTRTHMLMRGMYPAIPGWHCDGLVRPEKYAQPVLESFDPRVRHFAAFFATEENVSRTVFCGHQIKLAVDKDRVWGSVDREMSRLERSGNTSEAEFARGFFSQKEGELVEFDEQTLHRASQCVVPGWRWFFRLSLTRDPVRNQIRKQTQVYTTTDTGW